MQDTKLVIFDFDGTLYDFKGLTSQVLRRLSISGILLSGKERKLRKEMMGYFYGSQDKFKQIYFEKLATRSNKTPDELKVWYYEKYMKAMVQALKEKYTKRSGVEELLDSLRKKNIKTAVFSDYSLVKERVEAVGIDSSKIDGFFSAEECGGLKPAKESLLEIARRFGAEPSQCIVVGDRNDTDGDGARNAGMKFIQVKTHKTKKEEKAVDFNEAAQMLLRD